jgi:D-alanyl-D-alanine carboxypeptidase
VTLRDLLNHTSGIPDYSLTEAFSNALMKSPLTAPPPRVLLSYAGTGRNFIPGSKYEYSNSDNVVAGLMLQAATGKSYESELGERVFGPLCLGHTSLPRGAGMPAPLIHGYAVAPPQAPEDVTHLFAAGWAWASGGIVSTPDDANTLIRAYVRGATTSLPIRTVQFTFRPGSSEPPGPGQNSAGLAIFRYQTRSRTVLAAGELAAMARDPTRPRERAQVRAKTPPRSIGTASLTREDGRLGDVRVSSASTRALKNQRAGGQP